VSTTTQALKLLEAQVLAGSEAVDVRSEEEARERIRTAIAAKQYGREEALAGLIAKVGLVIHNRSSVRRYFMVIRTPLSTFLSTA
jgi:hypothetical protein